MCGWCGCNSCNCLDTDKLVAVQPDDTAGYLKDKLTVTGSITMAVTWSAWNRKINFNVPIIPSVISSDLTVDILYNPLTGVYDLSSTCCNNTDMFVATDVGCTPGYLIDQIIPDPGSPILVYVQDCKVRIGFNPSGLPDLDSKVAVDSTCTPGYLEDQLISWNWVTITKIWCQLAVDVDPTDPIWVKPRARITLATTYDNATIVDTTEWGTDILGLSITQTNTPAMVATANRITITKTGAYLVGCKGIVECNDAIHAFRVVMLSTNVVNQGALDDKFSGGRTSGSFTGWLKRSIYDAWMSLPIGQSNLINLTAWEVIWPAIRWSCTVEVVKNNTLWQIVIVGNDGTSITPPFASTTTQWFSFFAAYRDTF